LQSVEPILSAKEFQTTAQLVKEFSRPGGDGEKLQARLLDFDKAQKDSWLDEMWLKNAYLIWRCPTLLNVNWWCQFVDPHATSTNQSWQVLPKAPPKGTFTEQQLTRAAGITVGLLKAHQMIYSGSIPIDHIKDKPLCMHQYTKLFGITRIPKEGCDTLLTPYPSESQHIIVMARNQIYKATVLSQPGGSPPSVGAIRDQLKAIVNAVQATSDGALQAPVGLFTGGDRDEWAKTRNSLLKLEVNRVALREIDTALFSICLDDYTLGDASSEATHHQIFHNNGENRWFDKAISVILTNTGRAGVNGEHSPCDAVVPGSIFNNILSRESELHSVKKESKSSNLPAPTPLQWSIPPEYKNKLEKMRQEIKGAVDAIQSHILHIQPDTGVQGSQWIKEVAKMSPDSFAQLSLQLAYFRDQNHVPSTYESASTRQFKLGRTECVRTQSNETAAMVRAFDSNKVSPKEKIKLLQSAAESHVKTMKAASNARGCDRHLLGLRMLVQPEEESPKLFTDPAFKLSSTYQLSTSNMTPGTYLYGGFGAVCADGYGVNYAVDKESMKFSCSNWKGSTTDSRRFTHTMLQSIQDLQKLIKNNS
jgi:carnitine O-acetyltransferase